MVPACSGLLLAQPMKNDTSLLRHALRFGVVAMLLLASCQSDTETAVPSKTQLLTGSTWHITAYTRASGSAAPANYFATAFPNACERDDRYTFNTNGVQVRIEGLSACSGNTTQTVVGTYPWQLNAAQTQLTLGGTTFELVRLTASALQLRSTRNNGGVTVTDEVTYAD